MCRFCVANFSNRLDVKSFPHIDASCLFQIQSSIGTNEESLYIISSSNRLSSFSRRQGSQLRAGRYSMKITHLRKVVQLIRLKDEHLIDLTHEFDSLCFSYWSEIWAVYMIVALSARP